jgi:2-oxoacid:acceptor oxidoreductase gamma subunit (pyruvate/2-ketoisovalerate family)
MLEIRLHGRGGQGAQVGCQILAHAFFRAGRFVQAFAAYGGERRGAPVTAFLRVDDRPVRLRCDIEHAGHALVLDAAMLTEAPGILATLREGAVVTVNAREAPSVRLPSASRLVTVDAAEIARAHGLGPIVATAVLGAFAGATGLVPLAHLLDAVDEGSPLKKRENVEACAAAYRLAARPVEVSTALPASVRARAGQ